LTRGTEWYHTAFLTVPIGTTGETHAAAALFFHQRRF
jgi:hypothetical protein